MSRFQLATHILAPPEICFDVARDVDLHRRSLAHTREQAVDGRTSGLIGRDEEVTWRARHFGVIHFHTSRITAFDPPRHFRDEMVRGRFKAFRHDHHFERTDHGTRMVDTVEFSSPLGPLGKAVDFLVLTRYLTNLIHQRSAAVRSEAERIACETR